MAAIYLYRVPGEGSVPDPIELDYDRVRIYTLDVTQNAEEGSVATSTVLIDDPNGNLDIVGHRIFAVQETSITGDDEFVYVGYTAERKIIRGPYRNGVGRQWEVQLVDINTVLERRVMTGSDANRPAETDVQRVQWLEATNEGHLIADTRYLFTANPVNMDAVDYRGQMFKSILDDCAQSSGKDYWLTYFGDTSSPTYPWGQFSLWYGFRNRSEYASTIRLSNELSEVDTVTTFALSNETTSLKRDPSRVYSGVYMPYDGGSSYVQDNAIALAFARRDAISPAENVKTNAKATARATRYLADISTEEDVISFGFQVPAAQVNDLRQGMLVPIKATHLPGYEDFVSMRVLNRNVKQDSELTYFITGEAGRGGDPVVVGDVLIAVIAVGATHASPPTDLSTNPWTKAFWIGDYFNAAQFPGPGAAGSWGIWYRAVVPGESATVLEYDDFAFTNNAAWVYQVSGVTVAGASSSSGTDNITNSVGVSSLVSSASAGADSIFFGGFGLQKVAYGQVTIIVTTQGTNVIDANALNQTGGTCTVTADTAQPRMWIGYRQGTGVLTVGGTISCGGASPGDYNLFGRGYGGILLPTTGAFSISQSAFSSVSTVGEIHVTLSSPP